MRSIRTLWVLAALIAAVFALASCGGAGSVQGGSEGTDSGGSEGQRTEETTSDAMDHGSMGMGSEESARQLVAPNGEYSDAAFVDAMVPHHEGAVEMAEVALQNAEHEEIRILAREIIDAQRAEIEEFGRLRGELGGTTMEGMSEEEMNGQMGMTDARDLAGARPFDRAFIDAMMPHHESAIAMARVALEESENPRIRRIAEDIVSSQEREISQMKQWREEWYPQG